MVSSTCRSLQFSKSTKCALSLPSKPPRILSRSMKAMSRHSRLLALHVHPPVTSSSTNHERRGIVIIETRSADPSPMHSNGSRPLNLFQCQLQLADHLLPRHGQQTADVSSHPNAKNKPRSFFSAISWDKRSIKSICWVHGQRCQLNTPCFDTLM